jgi:hypothetical protein
LKQCGIFDIIYIPKTIFTKKNMKIYFSQVPHEDIDNFGDEGLFGPNEHGDYFYNQVEFGTNPGGTDEVAISDGCERYMPISIESIPDLIVALENCYNTKTQMNNLKKVIAVVESDTEAYVHDDHIHYDRESVQDAFNSVTD